MKLLFFLLCLIQSTMCKAELAEVLVTPDNASKVSKVFDEIKVVDQNVNHGNYKLVRVQLHIKSDIDQKLFPRDILFEVWKDAIFICSGALEYRETKESNFLFFELNRSYLSDTKVFYTYKGSGYVVKLEENR